MKLALRVIPLLGTVSGTTACDRGPLDIPPPPPPPILAPVPGQLVVTLLSPRKSDAAILFEIRGPALAMPVAADSGVQLFVEPIDSTTLRGIALGELRSGALLLVTVPDIQRPDRYSAGVIQAVNRYGGLRTNLEQYQFVIRR